MSLEVPDVHTLIGGEIVLELTVDQAAELAEILDRYDQLYVAGHDPSAVANGIYVPEIWHHTLLRLRAETQRQGGQHAKRPEMTDVVVLPRRLSLVPGGTQ
jgi:hypothetical protein